MRFNKAILTLGAEQRRGKFDVHSNGSNEINISDPKTCTTVVRIDRPHVDFHGEDAVQIEGFGKVGGQFVKVNFYGEEPAAAS